MNVNVCSLAGVVGSGAGAAADDGVGGGGALARAGRAAAHHERTVVLRQRRGQVAPAVTHLKSTTFNHYIRLCRSHHFLFTMSWIITLYYYYIGIPESVNSATSGVQHIGPIHTSNCTNALTAI